MSSLWQGEVLANLPVGPEVYLLRLKVPFATVLPGQFVHIRCGPYLDPLLRRPLSIHDFDPSRQEMDLLFQVVGKGTAWLATQKPGSVIQGLGPLGQGFSLPATGHIAVVAGGLGMAPLFFLARTAATYGLRVCFYLGARAYRHILRYEALSQLNLDIRIATDDGSAGFAGTVTELLAQDLEKQRWERIFACGPRPMLAQVADLAGRYGIPAEVSLEERMACGLGACRGCAVAVRQPDGSVSYENVCTAGPVFPAQRIVW